MRPSALFLLPFAAAGCRASGNFETGLAVPARHVSEDARTTWSTVVDGPRLVASHVGRDLHDLRVFLRRTGEDLARDGKQTLGHMAGSPGFFRDEISRDLPRLGQALSLAVRETGADLAEATRTVEGAPGWFAREFSEGAGGLARTFAAEGARARRDAQAFPGAVAALWRLGLW